MMNLVALTLGYLRQNLTRYFTPACYIRIYGRLRNYATGYTRLMCYRWGKKKEKKNHDGQDTKN
jgi:hypothetical protein